MPHVGSARGQFGPGLDGPGGQPTLAALSRAVPVLSASSCCEDLDRVFGRAPDVGCAVVTHPSLEGVVGLVERSRFEAMMSGPFGYGRSLYRRRPLAEVAQWDALTLPSATSVVDASSRAITRSADHVQDHVLVRGSTGVTALAMPVLLSALARALAGQALRDPLTGLANRTAFFGRVEESCRRTATQPGHQTAVVYLDLDGFKAVNDLFGHAEGDELLQQVASALTDAARPGDLVARLGGDEFAVCIDVTADGGTGSTDHRAADGHEAQLIARRMHAAMSMLNPSENPLRRVAASVGVAVCASGGVDPAELVRAADLAMYTGKRDGGNHVSGPVIVATSADADPLLDTSVEQASQRGELLLHFQPIVDLSDGHVVSVEALVRWDHPRLGLLTPDAFLPAVARAGQLIALDNWVLHTATREFSTWLGPHPWTAPAERLLLNVNVSTTRLLTSGLCHELSTACRAVGLDPTLVRVEVPETLLVDQLPAAAAPLAELRQAGIAVTFDDVGAGDTSLRHLRNVRADGLKIDRSYVQGMLTDERDRALVHLLVDFARTTGLAVTAEGVETLGQRDALLAMGCQYGQGWLFARPAPLTDLLSPAGASAPAPCR